MSSSSPHTLHEALRRLETDIGEMPAPPENAAAVLAAASASLPRAEDLFQRAQEERAAAEATLRHLEAEQTRLAAEREQVARDHALAREMYARAGAREARAAAAERQRQAAVAVADADGQDLRPDPGGAATPAELMATLRRFRIWAGNPSIRTMARRSGGRAGASTICAALGSDALPRRLTVIEAVIDGCGGSQEDHRRFATAWRALTMNQPR